MIINYLGSNGATVFTTLVLMTGITAAIPYGFSALAQIKWRLADHRALETPRFVRDMVVAVVSLVFSVLLIRMDATPASSFGVYSGALARWGSIAIRHPGLRGTARQMTQPDPVPEYR